MSKINELRRGLYAAIKPYYKQGKLPDISKKDNVGFQGWIVKTDNINCLQQLDLDDFKEIICLINPKSDIKELKKLPKNKVRIALPEICRKPKAFENIISLLLEGGYKKWEIGNYWAFSVLPIEKLDISISSSLYMLNSQAVEHAKEMNVKRVCFSIEDTLSNINVIDEYSTLTTCFVVYHDAPLFTSAGCIRDYDCKSCSGKQEIYELKKDSKKYVGISKNCQLMLFNDNPLCFAQEARNVKANFYRMDFCYKDYNALQVKQIADTVMNFKDIRGCMKANINGQKI